VILETLTEHTIAPLTRLMLELWPECSYAEEQNANEHIAQAHDETCYLARIGNDYIGFIHVALRKDYVEGSTASPTAYVEALYVKAEYRQHGVARRLMDQAEQWAKQQGCCELASDTELDNTASITAHKGLGFTEVNRIVCFIKQL